MMEECSGYAYYDWAEDEAQTSRCELCKVRFNSSTNICTQLGCGHQACSACLGQNPSGQIPCPVCGVISGNLRQMGAKKAADTNVFEVKLYKLAEQSLVATGDPVFCGNCHAMLNSFSQVTVNEAEKLWVCEFCTYQNHLSIDAAEVPKSDEMTYLLDPVPTIAPVAQVPGDDPTTAIFCIDTSGSMGTAVQIDVPISIKGAPPTNRPTRLDCVKAAIEAQINQTLAEAPSRHIGIVEFESRVTVHGDGSHEDTCHVSYNDFDALVNSVATKHDYFIGRTATEAKNELLMKLFQLHPKGETALGPGLLVSVGLAIQGKSGSKVIICTDGLANLGIGGIQLQNEESKRQTEAFYEQVGLLAQRSGVSVSVISVADSQSKLSYLSTIADLTEGSVLKVNPQNLAADFADILSERIVATEVRATVTMHKALKFKNENAEELLFNGSQLVRQVGNATQFSSFTFEYSFKTPEELVISEVNMANVTQLPFQLVIEYRNLIGQRSIKSYSKVLKVSSDRNQAEEAASFGVLHRNYQMHNARRVAEGRFQALQEEDSEFQELLERRAQNEEQKQEFQQVAQEMESLIGACGYQVEAERERGIVLSEEALPAEQLKSKRKEMMRDELSTAVNHLKKGKRV